MKKLLVLLIFFIAINMWNKYGMPSKAKGGSNELSIKANFSSKDKDAYLKMLKERYPQLEFEIIKD